ncbi:glycosyltransferase [Emticicia sp. ODNR4P]|nr:glycosyltransferase [Emticicia sp. ODNR4P]
MIDVVLLTYNAEKYLERLLIALDEQTLQGFNLIIIDSSSKDNTTTILRDRNVDYISISPSDFNHGGTRNMSLQYCKFDYVLFLTQDALPLNEHCFEEIYKVISQNNSIGLSYGRQVPYPGSGPFESFPRKFNYGEVSRLKTKEDIPVLGLKTSFCSNSFSIYNRNILTEIGGFPTNVIFGEDAYVSSKMILNDYGIYYCAEAMVYHSHDYSIKEEFKRYFDIGVFHTHQDWMIKAFSAPNGEGFKYVMREFKYLLDKKQFLLIPNFVIRVLAKFLGYQIGKRESKLSLAWKEKLSMHPRFWKNYNN